MLFKLKMQHRHFLLYEHALQNHLLDLQRKLVLFTSLSLLIIMLLVSPATSAAESQESFDHEHFLFTEVLGEHVFDGLVNYRTLKANPTSLNEYLHELAEIDSDAYQNWTRDQKLALWINAYNAFTLKAILNHYPIEHSWLADPLGNYPDSSIRQIKGVWDDQTWSIMGKSYTLNHMEHVIIRRELVDPRIHYVLVCASKDCPYLENQAFGAADLNERLNKASRDYIYDSRRVRIDNVNKIVHLPQIFKWFAEDFEPGTKYKSLFKAHTSEEAGILSWVYQFSNKQDRAMLENNNFKIAYLYYDWALNERP